MLLKIILGILVLAVALSSVAIVKNNVPLTEKPGLGKRLLVYLSKNTARTRTDHAWPELRTRRYEVSAEGLLSRVERAVSDLGWETAETDAEAHELHAVVSTPWLGFKDDIHIRLEETGGNTLLHVISRSRVGRADYGANTGHIMALHRELERS